MVGHLRRRSSLRQGRGPRRHQARRSAQHRVPAHVGPGGTPRTRRTPPSAGPLQQQRVRALATAGSGRVLHGRAAAWEAVHDSGIMHTPGSCRHERLHLQPGAAPQPPGHSTARASAGRMAQVVPAAQHVCAGGFGGPSNLGDASELACSAAGWWSKHDAFQAPSQ